METTPKYSTGPRSCRELAGIAIDIAQKHDDLLGDVLPSHIALAVEAIVVDLCDRRSIKHAWHEIDDDVQAEIKYVWGIIIENCTQTRPSP
jgi:hypothetical protein